jgi:cell division protein FtsI/penicillin-binding protein 2
MKKKTEWQIYFLFVVLFLIFGLVVCRLFSIQVLKHSAYVALAQDQNQISEKLTPQRGGIFVLDKDSTATSFATVREYPFVYLVPKETGDDKEKIVDELSKILEMDRNLILEKINKKDDPYEILKSKLSDATAEQIRNLNFKGVYVDTEKLRWYPQKNIAAQLLGFVGFQGNQKIGQYGLEGYWEKNLAGQPGFLETEKDALGEWILTGDYNLEPAQNGDNLYLTIDPNIQFLAEQELAAVLKKWDSSGGSIIVSDPKTGAIKAMASSPNYDPNDYGKVQNINEFLNPAIQKLYEPGSIFKPITMAAGIDTGKISPDTTYIDTGSVRIGGYVISNAANRSYGLSNMTKVLEKSINTGAVFAERQVGNEDFRKYVEAFGFNRPTGVDLSGEIGGNINNLKGNKEIDFATASFGQGIAVTPIELVAALGAIANEGKMMRPFVVQKIVHPGGQEELIEPQQIRQVVTEQTANKLTAMLVNTVKNGYDKVRISGYFIAGKTGTAQVPLEDKAGYSDQTIHTFVGYAPAYDPKFLVLIKMDKPQGISFASDSLGPVFANIARYLFNYYEIPPDEN